MIKKDEVRDPRSCLNKADDQEPLFVLRAQDRTAPDTIRYWLRNAHAQGAVLSPDKVKHANEIIRQMEDWHTHRLPD